MKKLIIALCISTSMLVGCQKEQPVIYQQAAPVAQPVIVQNTDPMVGVLAGMAIGSMMSNGERYDGHNGYNDRRYQGPPQRIVQHTTINKTVINNVSPSPSTPVSSVSKPVVPLAVPVVHDSKVKNPGDVTAEAEKAKMKAEADMKAAQQAKQNQLKTDIKAKQAARATALPVKSSFNTMSKSTSKSKK